jgi:protein-disulfide isomerase
MADDTKSTRDKAAAARAAALAEERARRRRTSLLLGAGLLVLIGLIVGAVVYNNAHQSTSGSVTLPAPDPQAPLPKSVLPSTSTVAAYGFPVGTADPATVSVVTVWEDFQCPACAALEASQTAAGEPVQKLATDGKIALVYRPAVFLDARFPQSDQSSARAVSAWGCAIDGGVGETYHNTVFAHQPSVEGTGYPDAQLLSFGSDSGLSGSAYDTFASCVSANTYLGWASNSEQLFVQDAVPGTPNVQLDGTEVPSSLLAGDGMALANYIDTHRRK